MILRNENGRRLFLTAEWRKLIMANYVIAPEILKDYLPSKTEPDLWNDKCYVSLVGFMFQELRVKGLRIPFHVNFPEINLRFYVRFKDREEWKRGVVFIREIVPRRAISFVANSLFNEKYITRPMKHSWKNDGNNWMIGYQWKQRDRWNKLEVVASSIPVALQSGSEEEFITEHYWGYSAISKSKTSEYRVDHPRWDIYPVTEQNINCDFGLAYGNTFKDLSQRNPDSVFLAEGSPVSIYHRDLI